jgi:adenylate cyclase
LPAVAYRDELYPSAAIEAARLALGLDRAELAAVGGREIVLGSRTVPLDGHGRQLLDHLGPEGTLPTWSLADLLAGRLAPALFRDRIVVLGASAAGAGDRFTTPFAARLPGSEHLGTALDNILTGRVLRHGMEVRAVDRLLTAVLAILAALLAGRRSPWWSLGVLALLLMGLAAVLQSAFAFGLYWLSALPPTAALLLAGLGVEILRLGEERRRRSRLERQRSNLARYFPPAVVDRLAASDRPAGLDRTQDAVVMFVDIVGFTRLSEAMAPSDAMALLRRFHAEVERAVFSHGGMVDKFLGDGAMACFGVPDPSPTAAADAIAAALALLDALTAAPPPRLRIGVGIHAGAVLMGNVGGATQFQFTVVGDTVNVASRLEGLTREFASPLIVSEKAFRLAAPTASLSARFELLPDLAIRGRDRTVSAYRLL